MESSQKALVSIIIPTYNCRQWISEAIDSALAQTYPDCEIIVVDDGSTDGTRELLREKYGDQIRYVYQENQGRSAARNHGLRLAQGKYIQFLDADDILMPEKVAYHTRFLEECPRYAAVYGRVQVFFDKNPTCKWDRCDESVYNSGNLLVQEIHHPMLTIMTLVRREWLECVNGFDESLVRREDWDLWLRIAYAGGLYAYLPGPVVALLRTYSYDRGSSVALESGVQVLRKLEQLILDQATRRQLRLDTAISNSLCDYGQNQIWQGRFWQGVCSIIQGFRYDWRNTSYKSTKIAYAMVRRIPSVSTTRGLALWRSVRFLIKKLFRMSYPAHIDRVFTHMTVYEKQVLYELSRSLPSNSQIIEIGSYFGASSCCLAAGMVGSNSELHCVDTFMNDNVSDSQHDIYSEFTKNTQLYEDIIIVHRGLSKDVVSDFKQPIDLLFVDGDHSWVGIVTDLKLYLPLLKDRAILVMHDVGWGGCQRALREIVFPIEVQRLAMLPNLYAGRVRSANVKF